MNNQWPDPDAKLQASDIDKILDEELNTMRPTDRKLDARRVSKDKPWEPEVKMRPIQTFIIRFIAILIVVVFLSLILLVLFGLILQAFTWVTGMIR